MQKRKANRTRKKSETKHAACAKKHSEKHMFDVYRKGDKAHGSGNVSRYSQKGNERHVFLCKKDGNAAEHDLFF